MRIFLTGATGFIGSAIVPDLIGAGHEVLGLTRSDDGANSLIAAGAQPHRGDLEDAASLRRGAALADAVIHAGFIHDFSRFKESCDIDRRAIETLGDTLAGSDRPLIVIGGVIAATEDEGPAPDAKPTPRVSEQTALGLIPRGVCASVVRLPQVHDRDKQGLVSYLIDLAREKGVSAYIGAGMNRWAAVHRLDAAPVFRLAIEKATAGARYHAIAEEGVSLREIAEAIGRGLKIPAVSLSPEDAAGHFGWLMSFAGIDMQGSSTLTRQRLGWRPTQTAGLIADLDHARAFGN